ncbi:electron transfer flavoprotein alpha subunit [Parelusimicrobium proximum]|uniref:electron transfer flavoprotein subunit alpha/FixB family protein n=1 Tax=Parelusimicrobium proximum TaxID=3228953 RepID=UPI003D186FD4
MPKIPKIPKFNFKKKKADTPEYKDVWIFAEVLRGRLSPTAFELLHIGRQLADKLEQRLCAVLMGKSVSKFSRELIKHGADIVYTIDSRNLDNYIDDNFSSALVGLVNKYKPNKFLFPATTIGKGVSAKAAVLLNTGLTADATDLEVDEETGNIHATRPTFGGNLMAVITCPKARPEMYSVRPLFYPKAEKMPKRKGKVIKKSFDTKKYFSPAKFISFVKTAGGGPDISEAEIIVAGGRGLKNKEGFAMISELASLLGGAVGATRPAVDMGWADYRHQIGLTGRTVKPRVIIACAISGQLHFTSGMSGADVIIAINKDPDAPMMKMAHYAVEGDAFDILPEIIKGLKK